MDLTPEHLRVVVVVYTSAILPADTDSHAAVQENNLSVGA